MDCFIGSIREVSRFRTATRRRLNRPRSSISLTMRAATTALACFRSGPRRSAPPVGINLHRSLFDRRCQRHHPGIRQRDMERRHGRDRRGRGCLDLRQLCSRRRHRARPELSETVRGALTPAAGAAPRLTSRAGRVPVIRCAPSTASHALQALHRSPTPRQGFPRRGGALG